MRTDDRSPDEKGAHSAPYGKSRVLAVLYVLALLLPLHLAAFAAAHPPQQSFRLSWEWQVPGGEFQSASLSAGEDCIVVTTDAGVSVLNMNGSLRWQRVFSGINPWMTATSAAAPAGCEWVAVVGSSSYKYVWVMERKGPIHFFRTQGTPEGVAVSHHGDRIAVGTADEHLYLLDPQAGLLFDRKTGYADSLAFSKTDSHLIVTYGRAGLYTRDGEPVWFAKVGDRLSASTDLKWFLVSGQPNHGPANGSIALLDQNGKVVWSREGTGPEGVMAPDGSYFVVTDYLCPPKALCYGEDVVPGFQILRPDGSLILGRSWPDGHVFAIADDGRAFLQYAYGKREGIYCLSPEGEVLWQFPEPTQPEQVLPLRNFSAFLILPPKYSSGNALQLYVRR